MTAPQTPPEGHGAPPPAAGDGQGSASHKKNYNLVVKEHDIEPALLKLWREERKLRDDTDALRNIAFHLKVIHAHAEKDAQRAWVKWKKANDKLQTYLARKAKRGRK